MSTERETPEQLQTIFEYLNIDSVEDARLQLKANLMKRVIQDVSKWHTGTYREWRSKLATRTSLSIRKLSENYLDPLIDEGLIIRTNNNLLIFVGLDGKNLPLTPSQIRHMGGAESKEELDIRKKEAEIRTKKEKEGNEAEAQAKKVKEGKN